MSLVDIILCMMPLHAGAIVLPGIGTYPGTNTTKYGAQMAVYSNMVCGRLILYDVL